jgi:hypothetical protein
MHIKNLELGFEAFAGIGLSETSFRNQSLAARQVLQPNGT